MNKANRLAAVAAALVFILCFHYYLATLNPVFRADDSPETVTSAVHLGIQHPPGYPLHTLVGRLFTLLPLASPAFRLNLMAATFGALASALLVLLLFRLLWHHPRLRLQSVNPGIAVVLSSLSGILLGLSHTFWTQSLAAKGGIYTFHAFLLMVMAHCLLQWELKSGLKVPVSKNLLNWLLSRGRVFKNPWFLIFCLVAGLAAGNHWETQKVILLVSALFVSALFIQTPSDPGLPARKPEFIFAARGLFALLTGFSIYLVLPIRARLDPVLNWGDPTTFERFMWVFGREQYLDLESGFLKSLTAWLTGGGEWASVTRTWIFVQRQGVRVLDHLVFHSHMGYPATALAFIGIWYTIQKKAWAPLAFWGGIALVFTSAITFYFHLKEEMIWILDVFLIPAFITQALFAVLGLAWCWELINTRFPMVPALLLTAALAIPLAASALYDAGKRKPLLTQKDQFWAYDFGRDFLDSLPANTVVFAEGDFNTMPIYYLQYVEGRRKDVIHLTTIFLSIDWGVEQVKRRYPLLNITAIAPPRENRRQGDGALLNTVVTQILQSSQGKRPIHASLFRDVLNANMAAMAPGWSPSGLTAAWHQPPRPGIPHQAPGLLKAQRSRWWSLDKRNLEPSPAFALSNYASSSMDLGSRYRDLGLKKQALEQYHHAERRATPPNHAQAATHLGIGYTDLGQLEQAAHWFQTATEFSPIFEAWSNLAATLNQIGLRERTGGKTATATDAFRRAEEAALQASAINNAAPQVWNNLGIAQFYQGKKAQAVASLEKAVALQPDNASIANNLNAIRATP